MSPRIPFHGWTVVSAAFVVAAFGWGVGFYGPSVYLETVRAARGWPVGLVSGAVTAHFLAGVLVVANLPRLHARLGLPVVTAAGAATLALGVVGWALARSPAELYGAALLSGAGWVALGAAAVNAIIAPWFVRRRPAALSLAYNGASVGGMVLTPIWVLLIGAVGFPLAAAIVGAVMCATVALLCATVLRRTPADLGQWPDGEPPSPSTVFDPGPPEAASLRRDPAFLSLAAGMALALVAQIGLLAHLVSLLAPVLGPQGAGWAASLATAAAIAGRTLAGALITPATDRRHVAVLSLAVQAAGCVALLAAAGTSVPLILTGVALIGLGIGNATSLPPLVAQAEFARTQSPRVVALIVATAQAAYAFAPAGFGLLREAAPEAAVYVLALAIQGAAMAAYLAGRGRFRARLSPVAAR